MCLSPLLLMLIVELPRLFIREFSVVDNNIHTQLIMTNPYKPAKGGLWNKSQCNTQKIAHRNQVKSLKHLHMKFYVQSEVLQLILQVLRLN